MRSIAERDNRSVFGSVISVPGNETGGIKVDGVYGFQDLSGVLSVKTTGADDPAFSVYRGGIRQFEFSAVAMKELYVTFAMPHDLAPGNDVELHCHWSNAAAVPNTGVVRWGAEWSYSPGYGLGAFTAPATIYVEQASHATRYMQIMAEFAYLGISATVTAGGTLIVRFFRDAAHVNDTCTDTAFLHSVNLHYRSRVVGTKVDNPPFYA